MGNRRSRRVFKKGPVAMSLRAEGVYRITLDIDLSSDRVFSDEFSAYEYIDEALSQIAELQAYFREGTPSRPKKGGRG